MRRSIPPIACALVLAACSDDGSRHSREELDGSADGSPTADGSHGDAAPADGSREGGAAIDGSNAAEDSSLVGHDARSEAGSTPWPAVLSETGLFTDVSTETLAPGVRPFQPKYVLWSDGATKRRWLYLPPGERIDTSDMDYWRYPVGTKVWKEFTVGGTRVETRLQYKAGPNKSDWVMIAYQWRADLRDADAVPDGVPNARGTEHDIPSTSDCQFCHGNTKDSLLGVTAIQLSHTLPGQIGQMTISDLITEGRLSKPPPGPFTLPGDPAAERALGYLHANCGTCHNPASSVYAITGLRLWESTSALDTVEHTTAYQTAVGQPNGVLPQYSIIEPGYPDRSELVIRMSTRGTASPSQMPPLATEIVDPTGIATVRTWIESLPPRAPDGGAGDSGANDGSSGDSGIADAAPQSG